MELLKELENTKQFLTNEAHFNNQYFARYLNKSITMSRRLRTEKTIFATELNEHLKLSLELSKDLESCVSEYCKTLVTPLIKEIRVLQKDIILVNEVDIEFETLFKNLSKTYLDIIVLRPDNVIEVQGDELLKTVDYENILQKLKEFNKKTNTLFQTLDNRYVNNFQIIDQLFLKINKHIVFDEKSTSFVYLHYVNQIKNILNNSYENIGDYYEKLDDLKAIRKNLRKMNDIQTNEDNLKIFEEEIDNRIFYYNSFISKLERRSLNEEDKKDFTLLKFDVDFLLKEDSTIGNYTIENEEVYSNIMNRQSVLLDEKIQGTQNIFKKLDSSNSKYYDIINGLVKTMKKMDSNPKNFNFTIKIYTSLKNELKKKLYSLIPDVRSFTVHAFRYVVKQQFEDKKILGLLVQSEDISGRVWREVFDIVKIIEDEMNESKKWYIRMASSIMNSFKILNEEKLDSTIIDLHKITKIMLEYRDLVEKYITYNELDYLLDIQRNLFIDTIMDFNKVKVESIEQTSNKKSKRKQKLLRKAKIEINKFVEKKSPNILLKTFQKKMKQDMKKELLKSIKKKYNLKHKKIFRDFLKENLVVKKESRQYDCESILKCYEENQSKKDVEKLCGSDRDIWDDDDFQEQLSEKSAFDLDTLHSISEEQLLDNIGADSNNGQSYEDKVIRNILFEWQYNLMDWLREHGIACDWSDWIWVPNPLPYDIHNGEWILSPGGPTGFFLVTLDGKIIRKYDPSVYNLPEEKKPIIIYEEGKDFTFGHDRETIEHFKDHEKIVQNLNIMIAPEDDLVSKGSNHWYQNLWNHTFAHDKLAKMSDYFHKKTGHKTPGPIGKKWNNTYEQSYYYKNKSNGKLYKITAGKPKSSMKVRTQLRHQVYYFWQKHKAPIIGCGVAVAVIGAFNAWKFSHIGDFEKMLPVKNTLDEAAGTLKEVTGQLVETTQNIQANAAKLNPNSVIQYMANGQTPWGQN